MSGRKPETNAMFGINKFGKELTNEELDDKKHRAYVGGRWKEMGLLQFNYLVAQGLKPHQQLLDVGCGALRGGLHFAAYLDEGHYAGFDVNQSLVEAGRRELAKANLEHKKPQLIVNGDFEFGLFDSRFDYALAVSVLTHLPPGLAYRCLLQIRKCLSSEGRFFASVFYTDTAQYEVTQSPTGVVTFPDSDPFHYTTRQLADIATAAGMQLIELEEWGHPHGQKMAAFTPD